MFDRTSARLLASAAMIALLASGCASNKHADIPDAESAAPPPMDSAETAAISPTYQRLANRFPDPFTGPVPETVKVVEEPDDGGGKLIEKAPVDVADPSTPNDLTETMTPFKNQFGGPRPAPQGREPFRLDKLTVIDLVQFALDNNSELAEAAEDITLAEKEHLNAIYGYLPSISFQTTYTRVIQNVIETDNAVFQAGVAKFPVLNNQVNVSQPIFNISRLLEIDAAKGNENVARAAYLSEVHRISFEVVDNYFRALAAEASASSARERSALISEQIAAEEKLVAAGQSVERALVALRLEQAEADIEGPEFEQEYAEAVATLSRLTGVYFERVIPYEVPPAFIDELAALELEQLFTEALHANPAMMQRLYEIQRQRSELRRAQAEDYMPTLDFFGTGEREKRKASRFGGGSVTQDFSFGVRMRMPIFNASATGYANREAASDLRAAILDEVTTRRSIEAELKTQLERIRILKRAIGIAQKTLDLSQRLVEADSNAVASGQASAPIVLVQKLQRRRAKEQLDQSRYEAMRAWSRIAYVTGRRLSDFLGVPSAAGG
ncbi:MAG: TolC family protein [Minwuia sp.]|uniref:TolC family protein n=1 Tax=Minwuia sp. TaxID=2493630 RepID=UPI003A879ABB